MADLEDLDDPEGAPRLPEGALAAAAARGEPIGRVPVWDTRGEIWHLAWPVMLAQVLVNAVGLVDIAMVGRLGASAVAAVGYAGQFFSLAQSVLFAVGLACVALMSRSIGAGDTARARTALAASLMAAMVTALVIAGVSLAAPRLWLGGLGARPEVIELAVPYLVLVLAASLFLSVSITLESALRADRDTRTPLWVAGVVTAVKLGGNALLIFGVWGFPRLELVGAGIATLVAQAVGLAIFALIALRARRDSPLAVRAADFAAAGTLLRDVVRIALPGIGERLAMNLALLAYFRVLAEYGTIAIAAYTVGVRLLAFSWIPGTAFGTATSTLVGQALGARDPASATRAGWRATQLAIAVALVLGGACALGRWPLARLFVDDPATVAALEPFLLCLALTQPFLQAHFALGGAHRGAGDTMTPFLAAVAGNWLLRLPLAAAFKYVQHLDLVWVWYALLSDHLTRAAWLTWSFQRGRWTRVGR